MTRSWDVLLIGGASGTGKTTVAPRIAARFGAACSQVDDFRLVLRDALPPGIADELRYFSSHQVGSTSLDEALERLRAVARVMSAALGVVVAHHVHTGHPIVIEGDGILPELATRDEHTGQATAGRIRAVFLEQTDPVALRGAHRERNGGFTALPATEQAAVLALQHAYGGWLAAAARSQGFPVMEARPWDTLEDRIAAVVEGPSS